MQKKRILLVDDDLANIGVLKEMLSDEYDVKSTFSGEEAISIIYDFMPDVVLLDIMMPGMSGYEVCRKIRGDGALRYIKVVLVSAKAMVEERLLGYEVGADDYITKPFDEEELLAKVKVFLRVKYVEELDTLKTNILEMMSRKESSPVQRILGFANLLKNDVSLSEESMESVKMIMENCMQMWRLAKKTQFMCDLKSRTEMKMEACSIVALINDAVKDVASKATLRGVGFKFESKCEEELSLNSELMRKALVYVFEPVIDSSPRESVVTISTEKLDNQYIIKVSDEGASVAKDMVDKLFDEFENSYEEGFQRRKGGLNLPITRQIVCLHDAMVHTQNNTGKGMTMTFKFNVIGRHKVLS